jgi:hypothetical protein
MWIQENYGVMRRKLFLAVAALTRCLHMSYDRETDNEEDLQIIAFVFIHVVFIIKIRFEFAVFRVCVFL